MKACFLSFKTYHSIYFQQTNAILNHDQLSFLLLTEVSLQRHFKLLSYEIIIGKELQKWTIYGQILDQILFYGWTRNCNFVIQSSNDSSLSKLTISNPALCVMTSVFHDSFPQGRQSLTKNACVSYVRRSTSFSCGSCHRPQRASPPSQLWWAQC